MRGGVPAGQDGLAVNDRKGAVMTTTNQSQVRNAGGTVAVRDVQLYVEDVGAGPTLLFIHGMCGDAEAWRPQIDRLSDRFRCVAYDRRGHSRSSRGEATDGIETHADDAAALIATLGTRPIVVASSGGGRIAVELARRNPELVRAMVLSEPPLFHLDPVSGEQFKNEIAARVEPAAASGGPRAAVDAFMAFVCPGLWSMVDEDRKDAYRGNAGMMFSELGWPPYQLPSADLAGIRLPALVISGTTSHPSLRAIAAALAAGLRDAELLQLADCGHVTYAERPEEFARAVASFAARLEGQDRPA